MAHRGPRFGLVAFAVLVACCSSLGVAGPEAAGEAGAGGDGGAAAAAAGSSTTAPGRNATQPNNWADRLLTDDAKAKRRVELQKIDEEISKLTTKKTKIQKKLNQSDVQKDMMGLIGGAMKLMDMLKTGKFTKAQLLAMFKNGTLPAWMRALLGPHMSIEDLLALLVSGALRLRRWRAATSRTSL